MHKMNWDKTQMLTDAIQSYGGLMLSVLPMEGASLVAQGMHCLCKGSLQRKLFSLFTFFFFFFFFFMKVKILLEFLLVVKMGTNVDL